MTIDEDKLKLPETDDGTVVFRLPFPKDLKELGKMSPIVFKQPYQIDYIHSYGQDSPFFAGLTNKKHLSTKCPNCRYAYGTPRKHCMYCGAECNWIELPNEGKVHTFTVCYFGSEEFLKETPFVLALIEWPRVNSLFLGRLIGVDPLKPSLEWIGMDIKAVFRRNCKMKPTDVYFIPKDDKFVTKSLV